MTSEDNKMDTTDVAKNTINNDNNEFMKFLNNYDNNYSEKSDTPTNINNNIQDDSNNQYMNYLNNYNNSVSNNMDSYLNNPGSNINDNLIINDVNPPITSNFNANNYVEDNPNYVDVSQNNIMYSFDDIVDKLKVAIDDIKNHSKYTVDTEEINFDDMYQVTIKIDKRESI